MKGNPYIYIFIMAGVSYLIRVLPLTLIRKEIQSRFLRSFLYYVPYVTLAVMTFPGHYRSHQESRGRCIGPGGGNSAGLVRQKPVYRGRSVLSDGVYYGVDPVNTAFPHSIDKIQDPCSGSIL